MMTAMKIRLSLTAMVAPLAMAAAMAAVAQPAASPAGSTNMPSDPNTYISKEGGFSITVPVNWETGKDANGSGVLLTRPPDGQSTVSHQLICVAMVEVQGNASLEACTKSMKESLAKGVKEFKLISSSAITLGNKNAERIIYKYNQDGVAVKSMSSVHISEGRAYIVTCASAADEFADYESLFNDVFASLKTFEPALPKPLLYKSDKYGFLITVPGRWEKVEGIRGTTVLFKEPWVGASDTAQECVIVAVWAIPPDGTPDSWTKANMASLAKSLKKFELISSATVKLGKSIAQRIVYQHNFNGRNFKDLVYLVVSGGRAFSITCTSTPDQFGSHEQIFEDICKTFEITASPAKAGSGEAKKPESTTSPSSTKPQ